MVLKKFSLVFFVALFLISFVIALPSSINIINPTHEQAYGSNITDIDWSFAGVLNSSTDECWYQLNGGSWNNFSCSSNLTGLNSLEGNNTWKLKVNDSTNEVAKTVRFWVDSVSPALTLVNPSGVLSYTNGIVLTLIVNLVEINSGFYSGSKEITRKFFYPDSGTHENDYDLDSSNNSNVTHTLFNPGDRDEGNYTYVVRAKDVFPNGSVIREVNITGVIIRDTIIPDLTITSPLDGLNSSSKITSINFTSNDTTLHYCTFNNGSSIVNVSNCASHSTTSVEGQNNWTIVVYDKATNSNTSMVSFFVDSLAPQVNITSPLAGSYSFNKTQMNFTASDPFLDSCWYSVDSGVTNTSVTCNSSIDLNSSEGSNTWIVYANDSFGHINSSSVSFSVDTTAPNLTLLGSNPQTIEYGNAYVELGASAYDNVDGNLTLNVTINSSSVNTSVLGTYNVTYDVSDSAGNSAPTLVRVVNVVDNNAPQITINSPSAGTYDSHFSSLNSSVSDAFLDSCWYSVDSGDTNVSFTCNSSIALASSEGSNTWTVYANDSFGNENSSSVTFTVDTITPGIEIISPIENKTYDVSGVILNVSSTESSLTWKYSFDSGASNSSFSPNDTLVLSNDDYDMVVYVSDSAGNENSSSVSFTVDKPTSKSSSSGGGGGGGCSTRYACIQWTTWSLCSDGSQERSCVAWAKNQACGEGISLSAVKDLEESRACTLVVEKIESSDDDEEEDIGEEVFSSGITGGVIGVFGGPGRTIIGLIGFLAGMAALGFAVAGIRHRLASKY